MGFRIGDQVMHWVYGLGKIVGLEERSFSGKKTPYYAVQVRDMTVWVPEDESLANRLRTPTSPAGFKKLFAILADAGEALPEDRHERKTHLAEVLKEGQAESLCRVIRDLSTQRQSGPFNENDLQLLNRAQNALLNEWSFSLAIPEPEAARDLFRLLNHEPAAE